MIIKHAKMMNYHFVNMPSSQTSINQIPVGGEGITEANVINGFLLITFKKSTNRTLAILMSVLSLIFIDLTYSLIVFNIEFIIFRGVREKICPSGLCKKEA